MSISGPNTSLFAALCCTVPIPAIRIRATTITREIEPDKRSFSSQSSIQATTPPMRLVAFAFLHQLLVEVNLVEPVTLSSIQVARARIGDAIHMSPCHLSHHLSELTGLPLHLKLENLQRTGSFKERGALNKLLTLSETERKRGVIAASAGNHAQGVAFHATARGIRAQIVMPLATPQVKVSATRGYGAEVILHGESYDEACDEALRRRVYEGRTFIHPFDDAEVISGQGTIGLELLGAGPRH